MKMFSFEKKITRIEAGLAEDWRQQRGCQLSHITGALKR